jgi:hypothetical protein
MLIYRQNSYARSGKRHTCRRETQSREPVNKVKKKKRSVVVVQTVNHYNDATSTQQDAKAEQ